MPDGLTSSYYTDTQYALANFMQPIAKTVLGSPAASVTFSSIPQGFTNLRFIFVGIAATSAGAVSFFLRLNGDTGAHYGYAYVEKSAAGSGSNGGNVTSAQVGTVWGNSSSTVPGILTLDLPLYAGTTFIKGGNYQSFTNDTGTVAYWADAGGFAWNSTVAVNSITLFNSSGVNFVTGSYAGLYGVS